MTERIRFLREETLSGRNKCARRPMPPLSTAHEKGGIPIRKALALKLLFDTMPLFIGKKEWIVGTRTYFKPHKDNLDGHDPFNYTLGVYPSFVTEEEIRQFGKDYSSVNMCHYTPDLGILLDKGVGGIIADAKERKKDPSLQPRQIEFLDSLIIAYQGLSSLIGRYAAYAKELSLQAEGEEKERLLIIADICRKISKEAPDTFREAVQLLWFGHLGIIVESFMFICYGRLDVILGKYLKDTPHEEAREILECLLLKMYDQADINDLSYLNKHEGQLVVTLGGVLPNGENAVNDVSMLFLDAIDHVRLPEPEFNLRISSKNPPEFLEKAAHLTVTGCNFVSYYNDDLFVESMIRFGMKPEDARDYGFDLCQDMNIPGRSAPFLSCSLPLAENLMEFLQKQHDFDSFDALLSAFKAWLSEKIRDTIGHSNAAGEQMMLYRDGKYEEFFESMKKTGIPPIWDARTPMCPLPYLSGMYHGAIENATDMIYECYPIKDRGAFCGTSVETVNSLAALKKVVFEEKLYSLSEVVKACQEDYQGEGQEIMRNILWKAPKWGNDDPFADLIAKDLLEYCLMEFDQYRTFSGGKILAGIHQPHPVATGWNLMATPEGRHAKQPVSVTMTPESGTMKNGATAALKSASIFDPMLIHWNYCVMINYYASIFQGEKGTEIFKKLLLTYFARGGLQHQPNVMDANELRKAQQEPEKYKDLIVRLWGVSAHFVDLSKELQDEMIARLS